ncbi:MAG: aryl-sulfate sulfotransferase [Fuerstiella sp.]|nr:aryl-sulfate sulfotransferase [Fuerstiella sp.]
MQTPAPSCQRFAVLILFVLVDVVACAQPGQRGVVRKSPQASPGYTLIAPFGGQQTFLINLDGQVVHSWTTERKPSQAAYLLEDGSLLRTAKIPNSTFNIPGGPAGGIQKISWEGELLWDYMVADDQRLAHHDIEPMPNGNVLVVAWELKSRDEAIAAGRNPATIEHNALWPEMVMEIQPVGKTGGEVVWEWRLWDHLVQSFDKSKSNFGQPAEHPELIDLNYVDRPIADWIHMNSIDYNPQLDQILLCGRTFDEIWVIDHSTTTAEAAKHSGGRYGHGGDMLYRWGNPFAWFAGSPFDQVLFGQHDPHWIPPGLPGAGNILIFNNGSDRDQRSFSTVDELTPPQNQDGNYERSGQGAFGPKTLTWQFKDPDNLFSQRVSGAQRLPNGNTLICSGETGHVFEVARNGTVVWDFHNELGATTQKRQTKGGATTSLGGVAMFRATRYAPDYPAFRARDLSPK